MPGYRVKHERIAISGAADLHIRSLLDRRQYSDPLDAAASLGISSAAWPMFGLLWPSARHLAAQMAAHPVHAGERILEIGCGLALASLVSHRRGADITASDCHPMASSFLDANLRLNGLPALPYLHAQWQADGRGGTTAGGTPCVEGRFDLIVGSDLLYERDDSASLARFIERHANSRARVWIIDTNRGNRAAFGRQMAQRGFGLTETRIEAPAAIGIAAYRGRLLSFRRRAQ
jgi:predicted nicotinamide N-methyase